MKQVVFAVFAAAGLATPAYAQAVIEAPVGTPGAVAPGAPGVVTRQPGSTGEEGASTYSPTGRAADGVASDSAASGNAGQPSRVGSTGSGGGSE